MQAFGPLQLLSHSLEFISAMAAECPVSLSGLATFWAFGLGSLSCQVRHQVSVLAGFSPGQNFPYSYCVERMIQPHDDIELKGLVPNTVCAYFVILVRLLGPFLHVDILGDVFGASGKTGHDAAYDLGRGDDAGAPVAREFTFAVPIQNGQFQWSCQCTQQP